jgi:hypothetical protein
MYYKTKKWAEPSVKEKGAFTKCSPAILLKI